MLGFVLDPEKPGRISSVPLLMRDRAVVQPLWSGAGAIGPHTAFLNAISGLGMIGLPGDEDGTVRRVPLFVNAGGDIAPGLALEAVRVWQKASAYIVDGQIPSVQIGNVIRPLPDDAMLRLVPARAGTFEIVTSQRTRSIVRAGRRGGFKQRHCLSRRIRAGAWRIAHNQW